jgi:hypothetical protein
MSKNLPLKGTKPDEAVIIPGLECAVLRHNRVRLAWRTSVLL